MSNLIAQNSSVNYAELLEIVVQNHLDCKGVTLILSLEHNKRSTISILETPIHVRKKTV